MFNELIIKGRFMKSGDEFFIANVCAPSAQNRRQDLLIRLGD